jgi:hypothetical protein
MTQKDKLTIAKLLRKECACGLMDASLAIDALVKVFRSNTYHIMDGMRNKHMVMNITWEENEEAIGDTV